jgi:hypothetical protein
MGSDVPVLNRWKAPSFSSRLLKFDQSGCSYTDELFGVSFG